MTDLCSPLMAVDYMVHDMNQSFPAALCILTAGTVPAVLFVRYCRSVEAVMVWKPMTSLSLIDF